MTANQTNDHFFTIASCARCGKGFWGDKSGLCDQCYDDDPTPEPTQRVTRAPNCSDPFPYAEAVADLLARGITHEQMIQITGFGSRRTPGCFPDDAIVAKYAAGALSATGVCGIIFGTDSIQHHRGHNL